MTDHVVITGVSAVGHHGVFDFERRDGQVFVVDVDLELDLSRPGASDDLSHTVNYAEVGAAIVRRIEGDPVDLIERLAELIALDALAYELVEAVIVTVHKPQAPVGVAFGDVRVVVRRERPWTPVVIAVGANLGQADSVVREAVSSLARVAGVTITGVSSAYDTDPVGGPEQPAYINRVAVGRTRLAPHHLLTVLHEIEATFGRTREIRWGARTLDLDLIQYGEPGTLSEVTSEDPTLLLPHPRAAERGFVLVPWLEVDPQAWLRVGTEVRALADQVSRIDSSGVRRRDAGEAGL